MNEQGMKPLQVNTVPNNLAGKNDESMVLRIGDQISLYVDTEKGYAFMSASGIVNYNARSVFINKLDNKIWSSIVDTCLTDVMQWRQAVNLKYLPISKVMNITWTCST
jgi:hypothetical protein